MDLVIRLNIFTDTFMEKNCNDRGEWGEGQKGDEDMFSTLPLGAYKKDIPGHLGCKG